MSNKPKRSKVQELQNKCEEYLNGWKRAQADYQNLKKEKEREKQEWIKYASADLIMELIPVYDNLKLAIEHIPTQQKQLDWVIGIEHIKNQLTNFLNNLGVEEIVVKEDDKFNPEIHEAVIETEQLSNQEIKVNNTKQDVEESADQIVKKQIKAGYKMRGKVIVPAKVIVE